MTNLLPSPARWQTLIPRIARTRLGTALFSRVAHRLDKPLFRLSRGRTTLTSLLTGLPIIMLETTGAKSGLRRSTPLVAIPDGAQIVVIASNFGRKHHPAWYLNLRAHPRVTVGYQGRRFPYVARIAKDAERERLWQKAVALYRGYDTYRQRAHPRRIPVIILDPVREDAPTA